MIGIIDYDAGNIKSVEKALAYIGEETIVSRDPEVLLKADKAILPGVKALDRQWRICTDTIWYRSLKIW